MATNSGKSNRVEVPEAKAALERFKTEVASELGVNLKEGYNGDLTSKEAGSIGGEMVRRMIKKQLFPLPLIVVLLMILWMTRLLFLVFLVLNCISNFLFFPLLMTEKLLFQQLIHKRNMKFLKMIHQHS